jgi:type III pantothenate kinase
MLLAVDIGNTSTKCGIYDGEDLISRFFLPTTRDPNQIKSDRVSSPTVKEGALQYQSKITGDTLDAAISDAIVCSVVPDAAGAWMELLQAKGIKALRATNELDFGLTINYDPVSALGTDRLVNALSAIEKFGAPAIVCSFGTATTIDAIDKDRGFLGGVIAPGMKTAAEALKTNTSQLPNISIEKPDRLIGNSTTTAIRSGIVFGHVAMVEGLIERITREIGGKPVVVATGGFASLLAEMTGVFDHVDENLTLDGLRMLHGRAAKSSPSA